MLKAIKKKMKDQRGLTLVELLAVIVILGIIAAIAVPSIGNIIDNTRDDAAVQDAIQIINAAKLAHTDNPAEVSWTNVDGLSDFLASAEDDSFVVSYSNGVFSIDGHQAAESVVGDEDNNGLTEAQLKAAIN